MSCRSVEPSFPDHRLLNSLPKAASTSPVTEPDLRKSKSPDHYLTALSTSQQSTSTAESPLVAPFHAETKLVATIPTTTGAASAVAASDSNPAFGNPLQGEAGCMLVNLGDTAPNSAAVKSSSDEPSTPQCHPLLNAGCNDQGSAASLLETAPQTGTSLAPEISSSKHGQKGNSPVPQQPLAAIHTANMQPCKVLQTLDMFDEVARRRHKQASKAALRVLAIQEQQLLWAAKSKGGTEACACRDV